MTTIRLKDKVLQKLADVYPSEMRFSELYDAVGQPSRSVFSSVLKKLGQANLVTRTSVSYKCVTYRLNLIEYQKKLQADKEQKS